MKLRNQMDGESLACLTRALDAIDAEKERKDNAERISRAVYARAEADRAKKAVAACLLQSYWRGINQREEYIALKRAAARRAKRRAKRTK